MRLSIDELKISEKDKQNPTVLLLLDIIRQQAEEIEKLKEKNNALTAEINTLKDEINRLKNHPRKPDVKPSTLEDKKPSQEGKKPKKRPGSTKRKKTSEITVHEDLPIEPTHLPEGARFIRYKDFLVQGIRFEAHNIRYRLKSYQLPDGSCVTGKLPDNLNGKHFSPELVSFILYQHYHCHVTQPLLLEQLYEIGIDISKGQINNILIEGKEKFHEEKNQIIAVGLEVSSYINVDDTGARHQGKNGYCTYIGNELFSWFESTFSKSRINFLKLMRAGRQDYILNPDAIAYMAINQFPACMRNKVIGFLGSTFENDHQWECFLADNGINNDRHKKIITEAALIGSIIEHGISNNLVVVSDDAGQFNVLIHALCWIHAERTIEKIIPYSDQAAADLDNIKEQIWSLYQDLKRYKENPNKKDKRRIELLFDDIFSSTTHSATLNQALKRLLLNKDELLLALRRPDIPLHNNSAENAIREYVKKRKISGGTRSDTGRRARDTFISLKKTCRKLGLSFWQYLNDRVSGLGKTPSLPDLIKARVSKPG